LRFIALGHNDCFKAVLASRDERITANEVHEVRALHEQLRHDGVVIVLLRHMTVGALLRFIRTGGHHILRGTTANRVRHIRAECNAREAARGNRLLLCVNRLAVVVVARDVNGATAAGWIHLVAGRKAIAGEHEHVVAERLEVVGDEVSSYIAFIMKIGRLFVGFLWQVAAKAARIPRTVAGNTANVIVLMRDALAIDNLIRIGRAAPGELPVATPANGLRLVRARVVIGVARSDRVGRLLHDPRATFFHHAVLNQLAGGLLPLEAGSIEGRLKGEQIVTTGISVAYGRARNRRRSGRAGGWHP
jgi:hypothetical protein